MPVETFILLILALAAFLFVGRIVVAILSVVAVAFLILVGLAIASDLITGGDALRQLAEMIAPAVIAWIGAVMNWLKSRMNP